MSSELTLRNSLLGLCSYFFMAASAVNGAEYTLTPVGCLPGGSPDHSWGYGINNNGDITGESTSAASAPFLMAEAYFWDGNSITPIGNLPPSNPFHSQGRDVNDNQVVAGYSATPLGWQAFKWDQTNGLIGLGYDGGCPGGEGQAFTSRAEGINNAGIIVGHTSTATRCAEAFTWQGGTFTLLGVLSGDIESAATDINDAADPQVVGASYDPSALRTPFIWDSTNGMTALGVLGGYAEAAPLGVNDAGDAVGSSYGAQKEATVWLTSNGMAPQGMGWLQGNDTSSDAWDINNKEQAVGNSTEPTAGFKAFIWDQCNGMRDLNNLVDASGAGWTLWWAHDINGAGQIAGYGLNPSGNIEAFLLTPITGACCTAAGCITTTESECDCLGGVYQGDGTTCDSDPCCQPDPTHQFCTGVCDDPGLQCVPSLITELPTSPPQFEVTECDCDECELVVDDVSGVVDCQGVCPLTGLPCEPESVLNSSGHFEYTCRCQGACCYEAAGGPDCTVTTQDDCENNLNGTYMGDNVPCMPDPCPPSDPCQPDPTRQFCTGTCDDPGLECVPTEIVEHTDGTIEVTKCDCTDECHIGYVADPPLVFCENDCPLAGDVCDFRNVTMSDGSVRRRCDCPQDDDPTECDVVSVCDIDNPGSCEKACEGPCPDDDPCVPVLMVELLPPDFGFEIADCDCDECQLVDDGTGVPSCLGVCPLTDVPCELDIADVGGQTEYTCRCPGACCYEDVAGPHCVVTTQADCENNLNGIYMGDNVDCTPDPCPPDDEQCPIDVGTGTTIPFVPDAFTTVDPHWVVNFTPFGGGGPFSIAPVVSWVTVGQANWIDPYQSTPGGGGVDITGYDPVGAYQFQIDFTLDTSTQQDYLLDMDVAADNDATLTLNSCPPLTPVVPGFGSLTNFSVTDQSCFQNGLNSLVADVNNEGGWMGLLVEGEVNWRSQVADLTTGTTNGIPNASGTIDPDWIVTVTPQTTTPGPAYSINTLGSWAPPVGATWIDPYHNGDLANDPAGWYQYEIQFNLDLDNNWDCELNVEVAADNSALLHLNNSVIGNVPGPTGFNPRVNISTANQLLFINGVNTLEVQLHNLAQPTPTPSGLLVEGGVVCRCGPSETPDCNTNGIPDNIDVANGVLHDNNNNGVPDECECLVDPPAEEQPAVSKNRYLSFVPGNAGEQTAIRVTFISLPPPYDTWNGTRMWVQEPQEICENSGQDSSVDPLACGPAAGLPLTFMGATLGCTPYYMDWSTVGTVHVYHETITPSADYKVEAIEQACDTPDEGHYPSPLELSTAKWGDACGPGPGGACSAAPDGTVDVANDVLGILGKFANTFPLQKARADLEPRDVDSLVNVANDVLYALDAFTGGAYPFSPSGSPPCGAD